MLIVQSSRGYYEIASLRFLDVICQTAHIKLFSKCQDELIKVVNAELNANCELPTNCQVYTYVSGTDNELKHLSAAKNS